MPQFLKKQNCPSAERLLAYRGDSLPPLERERVSAHLAACDFCGAEVRLLAHHPAQPEAIAPFSLSPAMEELAARLFAQHMQPKLPRQRRAA